MIVISNLIIHCYRGVGNPRACQRLPHRTKLGGVAASLRPDQAVSFRVDQDSSKFVLGFQLIYSLFTRLFAKLVFLLLGGRFVLFVLDRRRPPHADDEEDQKDQVVIHRMIIRFYGYW